MNTHTILIADDDPLLRRLLTRVLREEQYLVVEAENGQRALELYALHQPDLVLLDGAMPVMDGFEACLCLKQLYGEDRAPVLVITSLDDDDSVVRAFEAGASDYILKPIHSVILRQRMRHLLEMRAAQRALRQHAEELQARNEELDAFAFSVAHDLKNPVASLIGFAGLVETYYDRMPPEEVRDTLQRITQSAYKLRDIINALLLLARANRGDVPMQPLDMLDIVIQAQFRLSSLIEHYHPELVIGDDWCPAVGYGQWVEEVWANYLSNALKYGGRPLRVELGCTPQRDGMVRYWVRDNGEGLTPEQQSQLFTPFTRLSQVKMEGHGLGLAVVQRIVTRMNGSVGVDSAPGKGSTFWFTLPAVG